MPLPTKVPVFAHNNNILRPFASGWQGGAASTMEQCEIEMHKVKAESAYSAEDYFSTIFEMVTNSANVNLGDLTGTDLEQAETELFRRALADSIFASTWFGDIKGAISNYKNFPGFFRHILDISKTSPELIYSYPDEIEFSVTEVLQEAWRLATSELRSLASEGELAFFVSSDIYDAYHFYLESQGLLNYGDNDSSRPVLRYHGIPLVEILSQSYNVNCLTSYCILTDRRNLVLALNTADSPEKEIRMWYNPDEMENRQRVVFLAGTAIIDSQLVSGSIFESGVIMG